MAWYEQGRQEHGWFGHGKGFAIVGGDHPADKGELRARTKAAFEFAMEQMRAGSSTAASQYRDTRGALAELVPRWAEGAEAAPNTFRTHYFGGDTDPVDAWSMQRVALAIRTADTHAKLRDAGAELKTAILTVGLPALRGFLQNAQTQAALDKDNDRSPIQRIASGPEEEAEEEKAAEKRLLPHFPLMPSHAPRLDEAPTGGNLLPRIGGAAVLGQGRGQGRAGLPPAVQQIPTEQLRFSQTSAGGSGRAEWHRRYIQEHGTIAGPVDVVRTPDGLVSIDNTRIAIAREQGVANVPVRIWEPDDPLPADMLERFDRAQTWGEALSQRVGRQRPRLPETGTTRIPRFPK